MLKKNLERMCIYSGVVYSGRHVYNNNGYLRAGVTGRPVSCTTTVLTKGECRSKSARDNCFLYGSSTPTGFRQTHQKNMKILDCLLYSSQLRLYEVFANWPFPPPHALLCKGKPFVRFALKSTCCVLLFAACASASVRGFPASCETPGWAVFVLFDPRVPVHVCRWRWRRITANSILYSNTSLKFDGAP